MFRCRPEAVAVDRLVHQRQGVERRVQVAHTVVDVHRLDRVAGEEMDGVERLAEAQEVLVIDPVADAPATVEVRHVRRTADRPECHPVAAELQVVGGVPGVQRERRGRCLDRLGDHVGIEPDALCIGRGLGTSRPQRLARVRVEEVHPELGQDAQRRVVDRLDLVGGQDLGRPVAHPRLRPRPLHREAAALVTRAATAAAPLQPLAGRRVHVRHERRLLIHPTGRSRSS